MKRHLLYLLTSLLTIGWGVDNIYGQCPVSIDLEISPTCDGGEVVIQVVSCNGFTGTPFVSGYVADVYIYTDDNGNPAPAPATYTPMVSGAFGFPPLNDPNLLPVAPGITCADGEITLDVNDLAQFGITNLTTCEALSATFFVLAYNWSAFAYDANCDGDEAERVDVTLYPNLTVVEGQGCDGPFIEVYGTDGNLCASVEPVCDADNNYTWDLSAQFPSIDANAPDCVPALSGSGTCMGQLDPQIDAKIIYCLNDYFGGLTAACGACTDPAGSITNWYDENGTLIFTGSTYFPSDDVLNTAGEYTYTVECICGPCPGTTTQTTLVVVDCTCDDGCTYMLVLTDTAGNGWDGASLDVSLNEAWPAANYKLSPTDGECAVIPLCINDGGIIDLTYWNGAFEEEHGFYLLDTDGNIAVDNNGNPVDYSGNIPVDTQIRVKTTCPSISCAGETEDFDIRITLGDFPIEQSWEIYEGIASTTAQGNQVIGINATVYAGMSPGTEIVYPVSFDKCGTYTFVAFDGYNDGWDTGTWEIITDDLNYGTEITELFASNYGDAVLVASENSPFYSPDNYDFGDEDRITFTIPCVPSCTDVFLLGEPQFCSSGGAVTLPVGTPDICYPNSGHAKPDGCLSVQHIVLLNGVSSTLTQTATGFVEIEGSVQPYTGQTEMEFDGTFALLPILPGWLPIGCHKYVTKYTYCDGIMVKCTADINITTTPNPTMTCNDNVNISLSVPDDEDSNFTFSNNDDLGECVLRITPDMLIEMPAVDCPDEFDNFAFSEYEVVIYDEDGAPLVVYADPLGVTIGAALEILPLDPFGIPIFPGDQTEPAHDLISPQQLMQTLTYTVTHKFSGTTCWGTLTVEDKVAPVIICNDYDLPCNHPGAILPFYQDIQLYSAEDELPANIAGGAATPGLQSNTWIPINTKGCAAAAEVISSVTVYVEIEHDDYSDLQIWLHLPAALDAEITAAGGTPGPILLADNGEVTDTMNIFTPIPTEVPGLMSIPTSLDDLVLLGGLTGLLGSSCAAGQTTNPEDFITENSGTFTPDNLGNTWYVQVVDNDEGANTTQPVGGGEIIRADILMTCGLPLPITVYDCSLRDLELVNEVIAETNCDQSDWNGAQVIRTWQAIDKYGNASTCNHTVNLKAPTMDQIEKPQDISFECQGFDPEFKLPIFTGYPKYGCHKILAEHHHSLCDLSYTYEDIVLPTCGSAFKIIRTWTFINWCSGVTKTHEQIIKVEDTTGPEIEQEDITLSTDAYACAADIALNDLGVVDDCSGLANATASYTTNASHFGGSQLVVVDLTNGGVLEDLPLGITTITLTATDSCYNETSKAINVTVVDQVVPVAICDDALHVSLVGDGTARVYAVDLDEGSYDNCGEVTLEVRRTDGCLGATPWDEYVPFECCDIDQLVTVELRVTDEAGNTNICWEQVLVEDPLPPTIVCPDDKTIDCNDPSLHDPFADTPAADDNCNVTVSMEEAGDLDNCTAGVLTRTWTATDGSNKSPDVSCTQSITVVHVSDFTVQFPADVTLTNCPDGVNAGEPVISNDDCELVAVSSEDLVLQIVNDACYKIERTWTIINWCVYDQAATQTDLGNPLPLPRTFEDDGDGYFQWVQIIKILDDEAPVIDCPGDLTFCDLTEACEGQADLTINAVDGCSPVDALEYAYKIDLDNDGTFDIIDNSQDASGIYPYGTHLIKWIVEDGCGNTAVCSYLFTIEDCKNPTPLCLNGLSVPAMNSDGCVEVWANDFLDKAWDNCSSDEFVENSVKIRRLGTDDPLESNITFCCDELGTILVEVWVWDEAGNGDFCDTYIVLQDGTDNCNNSNPETATVAGNIYTEYDDMVEAITVTIESNEIDDQASTNNNGAYSFTNLPKDTDYTVTPQKDNDPLNGVSTYDLVLIARHILGIENLDSPYKMIAADVNNDGQISTFDIVQTRQLILYVIADFPTNTSWRFIEQDYNFIVPTNPFAEAFPEAIDFTNIDENHLNTDFIGVKIGDVSGDATANSSLLGANERNAIDEMLMIVDDKQLAAGKTYTVDFHASDFTEITGYQFTLDFDVSAMTFAGVKSGALKVSESNLGFTALDEGIITSSWNLNEATTIANDEILFSLDFIATENTLLSDALAINSRYTDAEAYTGAELLDVALGFNTNGTIATAKGLVLYQNTPNPFSDATSIRFNLAEASAASLKIYDLTGRVLTVVNGDYAKGMNTITIDRKHLDATGVLYYQLDTDTHSATRKMIVLH